jgi:hypothetical protein
VILDAFQPGDTDYVEINWNDLMSLSPQQISRAIIVSYATSDRFAKSFIRALNKNLRTRIVMSSKPREGQPDFVLSGTKTPAEVVALLLDRFPGICELVESPDELLLAPPFHAYECFASQIHSRIDDQAFLRSVGTFINELAQSDDPLIGDVLVTSVLESVAEDPAVAEKIAAQIDENARALLRDAQRSTI